MKLICAEERMAGLPWLTVLIFAVCTLVVGLALGFFRVFVFGWYRTGFAGAAQVAFQSYAMLGIFAAGVGAILLSAGARLWPRSHLPAEGLQQWTAVAGLLFLPLLEVFQHLLDAIAPDAPIFWLLLVAYPLSVGVYLSRR